MTAPEQDMSENNNEEDDSEMSYDSEDDDDSSFDSDMENEAQRLMDALQAENDALKDALQQADNRAAAAPATPAKPPQEIWADFVGSIEKCENASLKVTDTLVAWVAETTAADTNERLVLVESLVTDMIRAVQAGFVIIHVILERNFLLLLNPEQHTRLYRAILTKHASTITYWKLGSDDSTDACGIPTTALLTAMSSIAGWTNLTELEIRGLELHTLADMERILQFLQRAPKIRQFNLLGLVMSDALVNTEGLFDKVVTTVQAITDFDELQLCRRVDDARAGGSSNHSGTSLPPLISPVALENMLSVKQKWWRMAFDGMSLDDRHLSIIGSALKGNKDCKMNDLLSIQDNPKVTSKGLHALYTICMAKQRMGLVLSDDPSWVATFDLVRPLNNLHRRLEYIKEDGRGYRSSDSWIKWLSVVGNLPWIGEARKLNYIWFALLEQPELVANCSLVGQSS
ncbi:expressed unknown protein [Seminavis robusta]|uniref:Uncharacterized protein n=1 Tax=Seminavis robusta TaxID=568900 RepID=A0A9N8HB42_9STRA|nr:expressed unknown protein [Seminavis robusta]|eukprot:Sro264_g102620.1 n/a (458) ;mRNA; r:62109-63482